MSRLRNALLGTLTFIFLLAPPAGTVAQETQFSRIGIVDLQKIFREAAAAKSVLPQMDKVRREFQKEVRQQERALRAKARKLADDRVLLSPEEFANKRRALDEEGRTAQRAVQEKKRRLDRAFNDTKDVILRQIALIADTVAGERKIDLVFEKGVVFLSAKALDLTSEIITRLDKKLPHVKLRVEEVSLEDSGKEK